MNTTDRLRNLRILVVDDDRDTREMLRFILQQQAADVTAVESVTEAVNAFQKSAPDLLLTDIGMPDFNGYALIALLRENDEKIGRKTPAIALTAYTSPADEEAAMAAGFQRYMAKPFAPAELIEAIGSLAAKA
jgi:CheY-like chemotaxis protein